MNEVPGLAERVRGRFGLWLIALLGVSFAACEYPFEPYQEAAVAFSMFGYLDLRADTQWVRVMPVRQNLFLAPEPIDAVVTLEHLRTGRVVALRDSLFRYADTRLDGVAYAYNFWTTERLEPGESYRLRAARSDGATTTATIAMPPDLEISFHNQVQLNPDSALLRVRAERVLFVDVFYSMRSTGGDPAGSVPVRQQWRRGEGEPGVHLIAVHGGELQRQGLVDMRRQEIRVTSVPPDWPFRADLPDLTVRLPGTMPSNVENGLGFVGGVVSWTIPFHRCFVLTFRPGPRQACEALYNAESAEVAGRVVRAPCADAHAMAEIRLTERFAGGGAAMRIWRTGWDGGYRFEGIEPGSELVIDAGAGTSAVHIPPLGAGQRYHAPLLSVPGGC
jgi:hypothetical protein